MKNRWAFPLLLGAVLASAATAAVAVARTDRSDERFPHEAHARLFPLCTGCHLGVETGDDVELYPPPQSCTACHDDVRAPLVAWDGPSPRTSNLRFDHLVHDAVLAAASDPPLECTFCHTAAGAPRMAVQPPIPEQCFSCHAHPATDHFVDAECSVCHTPLAETRLAAQRLAALPVPESHTREDFLASLHGELAALSIESCATCHTREQCMGCHIAEPRTAQLPGAAGDRFEPPVIAAAYPLPASHLDPAWQRLHGEVASAASCASCHTQESCMACHRPPLPAGIGELPSARAVTAPGAVVLRRMPETHLSPFFATRHGALAAARPQTCTTCHDWQTTCAACHEPTGAASGAGAEPTRPTPAQGSQRVPPRSVSARAPELHEARPPVRVVAPEVHASTQATSRAPESRRPGGFHPPDYVLRHAGDAFGRRLDCSSCHSTPLFCRDCHQNAGLGTTGRLGPGYHDAEPVWLLRHGQAARQTLESCTSCHTQRDCMQCHSQLGAFRVSPHGPDFDARRAQRANPEICRACHLSDPLRGG
jgi:hypothetical protein